MDGEEVYPWRYQGFIMLIIGHRGARALEPENTLRALRRGMACADYVEVDVRLSRDGVPVAIHDAAVDRTTDGKGAVRDLTLDQLKALDAGGGEQIPTFQEVLNLVRGRCGLVVEIKEEDAVEQACRLLRESAIEKMFVVSFDAATVEKAGDLIPGAKTGLIFSKVNGDPLGTALSIGADAVLPGHDAADRTMVERAHRQNMLVFLWTLNTPDAWEKAVAIGVDGFASDDPCAARDYLRNFHFKNIVQPYF